MSYIKLYTEQISIGKRVELRVLKFEWGVGEDPAIFVVVFKADLRYAR